MGSALVVRKSFAILECLELDWTVPMGRVEHRPSFSMLTSCAYYVNANPFAVEFNIRRTSTLYNSLRCRTVWRCRLSI